MRDLSKVGVSGLWLMLLLILAAGMVVCTACDGFDSGDDDQDQEEDDDDMPEDPDAPRVFRLHWEGPEVEYDEVFEGWTSYIAFEVCDPDNNLNGGAVYIYETETGDPTSDEPIPWNEYDLPEDVTNCEEDMDEGIERARIYFAMVFSWGDDPPGWDRDYCIDLEVTDGDGKLSNRLENACVYVP